MLSVLEAAQLLEVSTARVRRMIADGVLPAQKVGRAWLLEEKHVMQRVISQPKAGRPKPISNQAALAEYNAEEYETEMHNLYLSCKEAFRFRPSSHLVARAESAEEAAFYMAVADFFLQQKQRELIKAGVF